MAITFDKQPSSRVIRNTNFVLTTTSQSAAACSAQTYQVRIGTNSAVTGCFVRISDGAANASTATDFLLGGNVVDYQTVTPGQTVSVIGGSAAGTVSVTELS